MARIATVSAGLFLSLILITKLCRPSAANRWKTLPSWPSKPHGEKRMQAMSVVSWSQHLLQSQTNLDRARSALWQIGLVELKDRRADHGQREHTFRAIEGHEMVQELGCFIYAAQHYADAANDPGEPAPASA